MTTPNGPIRSESFQLKDPSKFKVANWLSDNPSSMSGSPNTAKEARKAIAILMAGMQFAVSPKSLVADDISDSGSYAENDVVTGVAWVTCYYDPSSSTDNLHGGPIVYGQKVCFDMEVADAVTGINSAWKKDEYVSVGIALKGFSGSDNNYGKIPVRIRDFDSPTITVGMLVGCDRTESATTLLSGYEVTIAEIEVGGGSGGAGESTSGQGSSPFDNPVEINKVFFDQRFFGLSQFYTKFDHPTSAGGNGVQMMPSDGYLVQGRGLYFAVSNTAGVDSFPFEPNNDHICHHLVLVGNWFTRDTSSFPSESYMKLVSIDQVQAAKDVHAAWNADPTTYPKLAIVPWRDEFVEYTCQESPEVRFEDVIEIKIDTLYDHVGYADIDQVFIETCEPRSIKAIGHTVSHPIAAGIKIEGKRLIVTLGNTGSYHEMVTVIVQLSGIRLGYEGRRFARRTAEDKFRNDDFWNWTKPRQ